MQNFKELPLCRRRFILSVITCAFGCLLFALVMLYCNQSDTCAPNGWKNSIWPGFNSTTLHWCEKPIENYITEQQSNALSNLGFFFFGCVTFIHMGCDIYYLRKARQQGTEPELNCNHVTRNPVLSFTYGWSFWFLAIASFIFHSHETEETRAIDLGSIFVHFTLLCGFSLALFLPVTATDTKSKLKRRGLYFLTFIVSAVVFDQCVDVGKISEEASLLVYYITTGMIVVCILYNWYYRCRYTTNPPTNKTVGLGIGTAVIFAVALTIQEQFAPMPCNDSSWFQWHALWHFMGAFGFYVLYHFFRSDNLEESKTPSQADKADPDLETAKDIENIEKVSV